MYKIIVLLSLIFGGLATNAQQNFSFSIKGTVTNGDKEIVILSYNEIGKYELIDSTVVQHGAFELKGKLIEAQVLNIKIGTLSHSVFISPNTPKIDIKLDLKQKEWYIEDDENRLLSQMITKPGAAFRQWTHALGQKEQAILQNDGATIETAEKQARLAREKVKIDVNEINSFFNSIPGLSVFYGFYKYIPLADKGAFLEQFSTELHSSTYYKSMLTDYQKRLRIAPGKEAPQFSLVDTAGHTHNLTDYRGRYVLLDFGASWCYWCKKEEPFVLQAYQKHKDKLTVINIAMDTKKDLWIKDLRQQQYPWISISDLQGWNSPTANDYYVQGVPRIILIDPQGKIMVDNLRGEAMLNIIEKLIQ
ncbi:TlpA disulfide reductase family protein [Sphingobacterium faecale]|uniref:AhpC/TSA family protein n=1 Tax=Sphingobacterium faecale TaxID=2803775 RepID=A0ABS1R7S6_9SPHI|nr:TlpA disulfide reductase family protein [Sphingobacterium faecale]MBL1410738.1 AhpC/TSA family protein [Sphingobacterium faecale]